MVAASIPTKKTKPIIACCIYRPTDNNKEYTKEMCNTVQQLSATYRNNIVWVGGDSNLPDINWDTEMIEGHQYPSYINKPFINNHSL